MSGPDPVNHPGHYTSHPIFSGECWDITQHLTFAAGNATKYLWRAGRKNHTGEDLNKAAWYLNQIGNDPIWIRASRETQDSIKARIVSEWCSYWEEIGASSCWTVEMLAARAILGLLDGIPTEAIFLTSGAIELAERTAA